MNRQKGNIAEEYNQAILQKVYVTPLTIGFRSAVIMARGARVWLILQRHLLVRYGHGWTVESVER